jgi:RNA-binding protein
MDRLGTIIHVSGNRKLILRTKVKIKTGVQVFDEELRPVGKIVDVFGPVNNPYVSIETTVDEPKNFVGHPLYVMGKS